MDTRTLQLHLSQFVKCTNVKNVHVVARDQLHQIDLTKFPTCLIVNTNRIANKTLGHWIGIFISKGTKLNQVQCEVWDSYGRPLEDYNIRLPFPIKMQNQKTYQSHTSNLCGIFSMFFLVGRANGLKFEKISSYFSNNLKQNDQKMRLFYKRMLKEFANKKCCIKGGQSCSTRILNKL